MTPRYIIRMDAPIRGAKELPKTRMIWATTTPLYAPELEKTMAQWGILERAEIKEYNDAALEIVKREGLLINDLHDVIVRSGFTKCLTEDGCHMTEFGDEVLSDAGRESCPEHRTHKWP